VTTLLAIDDDVGRYDHLRRVLDARSVGLVVVACPVCVAAHLPSTAGVLLDYDLDSGSPCAGCGDSMTSGGREPKGGAYVPAIARAGVPVVVASASHPRNVHRLCSALRQAGVRYAQHSAITTDCERLWIGALWEMGAL
jgi:hypothetical protein